jgi:hypothetical protein
VQGTCATTRAAQIKRYKSRVLESHAAQTAQSGASGTKAALQTIQSLLDHDAPAPAATGIAGGTESRVPDNPWHGAEALHIFCLAQRQLYANDARSALRTVRVRGGLGAPLAVAHSATRAFTGAPPSRTRGRVGCEGHLLAHLPRGIPRSVLWSAPPRTRDAAPCTGG